MGKLCGCGCEKPLGRSLKWAPDCPNAAARHKENGRRYYERQARGELATWDPTDPAYWARAPAWLRSMHGR